MTGPEQDGRAIDAEAEGVDPDTIDTGLPIAQLQALRTDPSAGFAGRLRRSIERRVTANQATTLAWSAPWLILRELLSMLFGSGQQAQQPDPEPKTPPASRGD